MARKYHSGILKCRNDLILCQIGSWGYVKFCASFTIIALCSKEAWAFSITRSTMLKRACSLDEGEGSSWHSLLYEATLKKIAH